MIKKINVTDMNGRKKMKSFREKKKKSQLAVEFAVAFVVVVASLVSIGFIANAKGVFQNHFTEAADKVSADSGTAGAVNTAAANLQFLIQNSDGAKFVQAAGMYDDNPAQVVGDVAAVDNNATTGSVLGSGTSDGDEGLTLEEQYKVAQEGYAFAQENLNYAQIGFTAAENNMNQAYAVWQQAEGQYDYWCKVGEEAKKTQARQTADDLKDEYDQRVIEYEWAEEVLETVVKTANQAYQDMLDAEEALNA